jgi:hypothetical protein
MALVCARCATDNPQGNAFCVSCGAPLGGSPPMAPPDAAPPQAASPPPLLMDPAGGAALPPAAAAGGAPFLPPGYLAGSSPYLLPPPPPGAASVHRVPGAAIIAVIVAVLVIAGGGGVAYALLHKGGTTPAPAAGIPVSVPTSAPAGRPGSAPTPPASTPLSGPSGSTGGQTVDAPFAKVFVPSGFSVTDQESDAVILTPDTGSNEAVGVQSELTGATSNAQLDQALLKGDQTNGDPSAKFCSTQAPSHAQVLGSGGAITADIISICENLTPGNGPAFQAVDAYIDAVAQAADGSLKAVWFEILAPASDFTSFTKSVPASLIDQTTFTDAAPPR